MSVFQHLGQIHITERVSVLFSCHTSRSKYNESLAFLAFMLSEFLFTKQNVSDIQKDAVRNGRNYFLAEFRFELL